MKKTEMLKKNYEYKSCLLYTSDAADELPWGVGGGGGGGE